MRIECTKAINFHQKNQLDMLIKECRLFDCSTLTYPSDDKDAVHFFAYEPEMASALALCRISENTYECIAFTSPAYRRMNFFNTLYEYALDYLDSIYLYDTLYIQFIYDHSNEESLYCLKNIGAKLLYMQLEMELDLLSFTKNFSLASDILYRKLPIDIDYKNEKYHICLNDNFYNNFDLYKDYFKGQIFDIKILETYSRKYISEFLLLSLKEKGVYFYSFHLDEKLRGLGLGKFIFLSVLIYLYKNNYSKVQLQVQSDNIPAIRIYKKYGFKTKTKLSYYEKKYIY